MPDGLRRPKVLVLYNESPDWPDSDKAWTARMMKYLTDSLDEKQYHSEIVKVYENLAVLDHYNPYEWLIWNWVEEIGGQAWSDSAAAAEMEQRRFTFTGSPSTTLAFCIHRAEVKQRLHQSNIPTLPARVFNSPAQAGEWIIYPAIVKGANQHGSFGIDGNSIVGDAEQLAQRIAYMRAQFKDDSLIEPFLDSREFHVSVFGNGHPEALPPAEYDYSPFADMHDRLYTYRWKYDDHSWGFQALKIIAPSPTDNLSLRDRLQTIAVEAYKALHLADYGRIDIRLWGEEPQVLDVNPNPDLDLTSALIASAGAVGLSYADVVERIIEHASARMPQ